MFKRRFYPISLMLIGVVIGFALQPLVSTMSYAQPGCQTFPETKKTVCGRFLEYWQKNGGLAQQGLPLSGEFTEVSDLNGKPYTVQYFERAVFEKHPENAAPYDVLLSQLGTIQFKRKYPKGEPAGGSQATPAPTRPAGAEFQVLQTRIFPNIYGDTNLVGVMKYNGTTSRSPIDIEASLSDSTGKVLGTARSYAYHVIVRPGATIPMSLYFDGRMPTNARVDIVVHAPIATADDESYFTTSFQIEQAALTDKGKVVGRVKNTGTKAAESVSLVAIFYSADDKLLDVESGYTALNVLEPGGVSAFEIFSSYADGATRVEVIVAGGVNERVPPRE